LQTENDTGQLGSDKIARLLVRFSVPAITGMLVMATYNIVDTIFVGMLGSEAIAALSIAFPFQMMLGAFAIGTGVGAASLISRSLGAGQKEIAQRTVGQVITLSVIAGIIVAAAGFLFLRPLLAIFGATPEIMGLTGEYVIVITTGSMMLFLLMALNNVVRGVGRPTLSMQIMIISSVVNVVLDPIFIFTLGLGVQGAALATVLAKIIGVIIMLHFFITGRGEIKINWSSLIPHSYTIRQIYIIGFPAMILQASTNVSLMIANNILAAYGHLPIAALGLIFRLIMFALMPVIGVSQGLLPIIGYNYGARKPGRIREAIGKGLFISITVVTFLGVCYFTWPSLFLSIFSREAELIELGSYALRIMVIMFPTIAAQITFTTYFQAAGRGWPSLLLSVLRELLVFIPLLFIFSGAFGLNGVWIARPASDLIAFLVTFFLFRREMKMLGSSGQQQLARMEEN